GFTTIIDNAGTLISGAELNRLDGVNAALVDTNDAVNTAITGTGALDSGSITSNFGSIDTGADNITTTGTVSGNNLTRSSAGLLNVGVTNATSIAFGSASVTGVTITTDGTGNAELVVPDDSISPAEVDDTGDTPGDEECLTYESTGTKFEWQNCSAGAGDITSVGDVASGAAFDGTQGTTLTFNDADGDQTFLYDTTDNEFEISDDLNVLANTILGSTAVINFTDFDVDADGKVILAPDTAGDALTVVTGAAADIQGFV